MKRIALMLAAALLTAPAVLFGQSYSASAPMLALEGVTDGGGGHAASTTPASGSSNGPLSHVAFGGGISPLGIQLQATTNLAKHLNLRASGSFFNYSTN